MSVHPYKTDDGTRYRVRWRNADKKLASRSFTSKSEAQAFDIEVKARKRRFEPLPTPPSYTLARAWDDWLTDRTGKRATATIASHRSLWNAHIKGTALAETSLGLLVGSPGLIVEHLDELRGKDARNKKLPAEEQALLGDAPKRRLMMVLSAVFRRAVIHGKIPLNPIRELEKPRATPETTRRPFPPILIERIRRQLLSGAEDEAGKKRAQGYACLVSIIAYGGLRPAEALALQVRDVGENIITVDKAVTQSPTKSTVGHTKTKKKRSPPLTPPLAEDLVEWFETRGGTNDTAPVIPSTDGKIWTLSMYRNWRRRVWKPAVEALAAADANLDWLALSRPYDLRHSFVSLELRAGVPPIEVAENAGHGIEVMDRYYASTIKELVGQPQVSSAEQISRARRLLAEETPEEVAELTAESLKPPQEITPEVSAILYGDHPRS